MFYTLHDFMLHSKGVTYVLMGLAVLGLLVVWLWLNDRSDESYDRFDIEPEHHKK